MYDTPDGFMKPDVVVSHFHLIEGDKVADFGAGSGHYLQPLSQAVGVSGVIYACEIQKNLVDTLGNKARDERLKNVHPMWCDFEKIGGVKLNDGLLDVVLLSNTLFQMSDKETGIKEAQRILRVGGKLIVIDWTDSFGGMGPTPGHVVTESAARTLIEGLGFSYERTFPGGEHHYGLVFKKQ